MKKYAVLLFLIAFCFLSFQNKPVNWAGKYQYEEDPVKGLSGVSASMMWDLAVTSNNNGVLEVNGEQTFLKISIDVINTDKSITILYDKLLDGNDYGAYKKGQTLLILKRINGKLITQWAALKPRLLDKYPKECSCYVKK